MSLPECALGLLVLCSWMYSGLTVWSARRWSRSERRSPNAEHLPPVTILKPVRGADPEQSSNFESFFRLDYPQFQLVFGALDASDPGLDSARCLSEQNPQIIADIVAGGDVIGHNRKVSNLAAMLPSARHDILVLSDSDMRVNRDYLRRVVAPFSDPAVGLVTCPYRGYGARGLASSLEAYGIGADFIPSALVAYYVWGVRFAFGSTIAIRRDVLDKIGGFEALADELADDFVLADRTRRAGYEVVLSDYVVDDVLGRESLREMWDRRLRWAKTARAMRPGPYAGSFITHGTVIALLFAAATGFDALGWSVLGATIATRAACALWIAVRYTHDDDLPRLLPGLLASDILSFVLFMGSFFGRTIVWRGERFRLVRGGKLQRRSAE